MMSEQQFETVLAAVADVQVAVDAVGLDMQRVLEIISAADSPQPPEWVNGGAEDAAGKTEEHYPSVAYPPPARARVGAAAGYVVIAACVALLVAVLVLLHLLGN